MTYKININGKTAETLAAAQRIADACAFDYAYSVEYPESIGIINQHGNVVARRGWSAGAADMAGCIDCSPYGYYSPWEEIYPDDYYIMCDINQMGQDPVCCDAVEMGRLNEEMDCEDPDELWRYATAEDIIAYGAYRGADDIN